MFGSYRLVEFNDCNRSPMQWESQIVKSEAQQCLEEGSGSDRNSRGRETYDATSDSPSYFPFTCLGEELDQRHHQRKFWKAIVGQADCWRRKASTVVSESIGTSDEQEDAGSCQEENISRCRDFVMVVMTARGEISNPAGKYRGFCSTQGQRRWIKQRQCGNIRLKGLAHNTSNQVSHMRFLKPLFVLRWAAGDRGRRSFAARVQAFGKVDVTSTQNPVFQPLINWSIVIQDRSHFVNLSTHEQFEKLGLWVESHRADLFKVLDRYPYLQKVDIDPVLHEGNMLSDADSELMETTQSKSSFWDGRVERVYVEVERD
ncbi:hypothetical protein C8J56DRAFT_898735 [Mycena floridula]|nr:hypothetical protein C8J56DRAFT_898735 [Mycena floridula]